LETASSERVSTKRRLLHAIFTQCFGWCQVLWDPKVEKNIISVTCLCDQLSSQWRIMGGEIWRKFDGQFLQ
jgi:hypothetical protein